MVGTKDAMMGTKVPVIRVDICVSDAHNGGMTNTEFITTHQLRVGDVILSDGMRLLVDIEPTKSNHAVTNEGGSTYYTPARVLNYEALKANAEAGNSTARYLVSFIREDMEPSKVYPRGRYDAPRWTIQGNGWATWRRVTDEFASRTGDVAGNGQPWDTSEVDE